MATKPTQQNVWNTDDLNDTAPNSAKIALGWVVNEQPSSSTFNWGLKYLFKVAAYLLEGVLTGNHSITGPASSANPVLDVVSGSTSTYGVRATALNGVGLQGSGSAAGVVGYGTAATGLGVNGIGNTSGAGVAGVGGATGAGVTGNGGSTSGAGGIFIGTGGNSDGVTSTGHGTGSGINATGGASGAYGGSFTGGASNGGGLIASAAGTGAAVAGLMTGAGSAGYFQASGGTGYCVECVPDTSTPARAALALSAQDANPSVPAKGDVYVNTDGTLRYYNGTVWKTVATV